MANDSGISVKRLGVAPVSVPVSIPELEGFCACDFRCEFKEVVFASDSSEDYKKDFSDFLFKKLGASDTVEILLFKNGVQVATITDNSLGTYYDGFATQPLYVGWLADWTLIFNTYGGGSYKVQANLTILGTLTTFTSRTFKIYPFDEVLAADTVKVESWQNGNVLSSQFDFTNLLDDGWKSQIRLPAKLVLDTPEFEEDKILNSNFELVQNYEKTVINYRLDFYQVSESVLLTLAQNRVLANRVALTDYNVFSDQKYQAVSLSPKSFNDVAVSHYGKVTGSITLTTRSDNNRKRNF